MSSFFTYRVIVHVILEDVEGVVLFFVSSLSRPFSGRHFVSCFWAPNANTLPSLARKKNSPAWTSTRSATGSWMTTPQRKLEPGRR